MKRRDLLRSVPATVVVGLAPAPAAPASSSGTAIQRLFRRHQELVAAAATHPDGDDDVLELLFYQEADAIAAEMMSLPAVTAADFAAKAIVATARGGLCLDWSTDPFWAEARSLVAA